MPLAEDGPPTCPSCDAVIMPTWNYCATCGFQLRDPDSHSGIISTDPDPEPPLDHHNDDHLRWAYEEHDSISDAAELFEVSYPTVRKAMIEHGVYESDTYG